MRRLLVAVILLDSACSLSDTPDSTTSTTTPTSTTTTDAVTTTESPATTPTTLATTTTTTSVPSTTTPTGLEGTWADEPLITAVFGALGWWDGSEWTHAEAQGEPPLAIGEDYQTARLDESAFFEGFTVTISECVNNDLGPVSVLETGCGV